MANPSIWRIFILRYPLFYALFLSLLRTCAHGVYYEWIPKAAGANVSPKCVRIWISMKEKTNCCEGLSSASKFHFNVNNFKRRQWHMQYEEDLERQFIDMESSSSSSSSYSSENLARDFWGERPDMKFWTLRLQVRENWSICPPLSSKELNVSSLWMKAASNERVKYFEYYCIGEHRDRLNVTWCYHPIVQLSPAFT